MDVALRDRVLKGRTFYSDFEDEGDPSTLIVVGLPSWILGLMGLLSPSNSVETPPSQDAFSFSFSLFMIGLACCFAAVNSIRKRRTLRAQAEREARSSFPPSLT